jgi:hypothetical protein
MFNGSKMSFVVTLSAFCAFAGCLVAFAASGQKSGKKTSSVSVTGCLHKGVVLDRFSLTGQDGKSYALRSSSVNLSDHVGHTVTIKGELKPDRKREDYDFEGSEVNEEYGKGKTTDFVDVEVTSLKEVGGSCQQNKNGR